MDKLTLDQGKSKLRNNTTIRNKLEERKCFQSIDTSASRPKYSSLHTPVTSLRSVFGVCKEEYLAPEMFPLTLVMTRIKLERKISIRETRTELELGGI
jgi:hypothetical protein